MQYVYTFLAICLYIFKSEERICCFLERMPEKLWTLSQFGYKWAISRFHEVRSCISPGDPFPWRIGLLKTPLESQCPFSLPRLKGNLSCWINAICNFSSLQAAQKREYFDTWRMRICPAWKMRQSRDLQSKASFIFRFRLQLNCVYESTYNSGWAYTAVQRVHSVHSIVHSVYMRRQKWKEQDLNFIKINFDLKLAIISHAESTHTQ